MTYFVTGGTGFIGRHLVEDLLRRRRGRIHVLCRESSLARFDRLHRTRWSGSTRVVPVVGDLTSPLLGVDPVWLDQHRGGIRHFFHLAALYDMTAPRERNVALNVDGTREALALARQLEAGVVHHVSSVAVAGDFHGEFDETMFDCGQVLPSPYHATKFEAERIVRTESDLPWRIYRPSLVVGHSESGVMDKVDGPYYVFPAIKRLRDTLPQWAPLPAVDLGDTNVVPVDFVAAALDHLAHLRGRNGQTFHLVNPQPQPVVDLLNTVARAARAPRFVQPVGREVISLLPDSLKPVTMLTAVLRTAPAQVVLAQTLGRLGIPPEVLGHVSLPASYATRQTERALAGSGIACPPLASYAAALWDYWEQHLDPSAGRDDGLRRAVEGRTVVITGATSGIGKATALKVARAGGHPVLVARGRAGLEATRSDIEAIGGTASIYPCDLSDLAAIDALTKQIAAEHDSVDYVVNNAGRSIRRSLRLSEDRFHDFQRTMQLNYFGAVRLMMGLIPTMRAQRAGHVVNVSSIGVQTNPPRFSAYVASKAALDAWSRVVSSELIGDGVTFTTIHMPLVRTPMIAPTRIYDAFPTITPAQAADLVLRAMKDRPHEVNTTLGTVGEVAHALAPKAVFRVLHTAYQVFPDSSAARGEDDEEQASREALLLARILRGVHW